MLQFLPQLVRRGYASPYHFALSRDLPLASRVQIHHAYVELAGGLQRSASDDWNVIRDKLLIAQLNFGFHGAPINLPIAPPEGNTDQ